jgi:polysaccharide pyruvyl transferase WcaK-like protein
VLDHGQQNWGEKYGDYLLEISRELVTQHLRVQVIVHDASGDDLELALYICRKMDSPAVTIVQEQDPIALKHLIGESLLLIGSRYHSLAGALSSQVPVIAMGWSHKYEELLGDFGLEDSKVSADMSIGAVLEMVHRLVNLESNASCRMQIGQKLRGMFPKNQEMWKLVTDTLLPYAR